MQAKGTRGEPSSSSPGASGCRTKVSRGGGRPNDTSVARISAVDPPASGRAHLILTRHGLNPNEPARHVSASSAQSAALAALVPKCADRPIGRLCCVAPPPSAAVHQHARCIVAAAWFNVWRLPTAPALVCLPLLFCYSRVLAAPAVQPMHLGASPSGPRRCGCSGFNCGWAAARRRCSQGAECCTGGRAAERAVLCAG